MARSLQVPAGHATRLTPSPAAFEQRLVATGAMDEVDRLLEEEDDDAAEEQMAFLDDLDPSAAVVPAVADVDTTTWVRPALPADMSSAKDKIGASPSLCA